MKITLTMDVRNVQVVTPTNPKVGILVRVTRESGAAFLVKLEELDAETQKRLFN